MLNRIDFRASIAARWALGAFFMALAFVVVCVFLERSSRDIFFVKTERTDRGPHETDSSSFAAVPRVPTPEQAHARQIAETVFDAGRPPAERR